MHPETSKLEEVIHGSKDPELMIELLLLVAAVYKTSDAAAEFIDVTIKMIDDSAYLPDNMIDMPGDHPEAEKALRELMGKLLGRRI